MTDWTFETDIYCDDDNDCTEDFCVAETGECVFVDIVLCCGDGVCSADENCVSCAADCGACSGDCCESNGSIGCADAEIQSCVCDLDPYCCDNAWDSLCGTEAAANCFGCGVGETCEQAVDLGNGGTFSFDLCNYVDDGGYDWCGNQGADYYVKLNAQQASGALAMDIIESFPALIVNYRFYNQGMCEQESDWYCYENAPATVGWGGYQEDWELYLAFGSSDGSCGPVTFSLAVE